MTTGQHSTDTTKVFAISKVIQMYTATCFVAIATAVDHISTTANAAIGAVALKNARGFIKVLMRKCSHAKQNEENKPKQTNLAFNPRAH